MKHTDKIEAKPNNLVGINARIRELCVERDQICGRIKDGTKKVQALANDERGMEILSEVYNLLSEFATRIAMSQSKNCSSNVRAEHLSRVLSGGVRKDATIDKTSPDAGKKAVKNELKVGIPCWFAVYGNDDAEFTSYLSTVIRNALLNVIKSYQHPDKNVELTEENEWVIRAGAATSLPPTSVVTKSDIRDVEDFVWGRLIANVEKESHRDILRMYFVEGESTQKVAKALGVSTGIVSLVTNRLKDAAKADPDVLESYQDLGFGSASR